MCVFVTKMSTEAPVERTNDDQDRKIGLKSKSFRKRSRNRKLLETMEPDWREMWKKNIKNQRKMKRSNNRMLLKDKERRKSERLSSNFRSKTLKPEWETVFKSYS